MAEIILECMVESILHLMEPPHPRNIGTRTCACGFYIEPNFMDTPIGRETYVAGLCTVAKKFHEARPDGISKDAEWCAYVYDYGDGTKRIQFWVTENDDE